MHDASQPHYIAVEQLCIGLFVRIELGWLDHNFPLNSFKIKNAQQIEQIRQLGLKEILYDPARSDCTPLPIASEDEAAEEAPEPLPSPPEPEENSAATEKKARIEKLSLQRAAVAQCEKQFSQAASVLKSITSFAFSKPKEAHRNADKLVQQMLDSILTDKDVAIQLMNDKVAGEEVYYHSLNVSVLAVMLAKELALPESDIKHLGVGCLFHDIGKMDIPDRILMKTDPLTQAEVALYQQHCRYGEAAAQKMGLPKPVIDIIVQHHEHVDGSGYPRRLKGEQISPLARIVDIVNTYDNYCNQPNPADSLTPYEALSYMFSHQRSQFEATPLNMFIRCMGVYPPGTIVRLSDLRLGMVVSVNSNKPLRPNIVVYEPSVPKEEAIMVDLQNEPDLNVSESLKPGQLPREVHDYLSPRKRMTYYFNSTQGGFPTP